MPHENGKEDDLTTELFKWFGLNRAKRRIVTISINHRCPLRCRHCMVGFSEHYSGDNWKISETDLVEIIEAVDPLVYSQVVLAGGEPSLEAPLICVAIGACHAKGLHLGIVTAPIWAATPAMAERFLDSVAGLDRLTISCDRYHLEFLKMAHYETAVRAARDRGIYAAITMSYADDAERDVLVRQVGAVLPNVPLGGIRIVPVGNAADPSNVPPALIRVETPGDLARIPRGCTLGHSHIDEHRALHGCCWSRLAAKSPFSVSNNPHGLREAFNQLEQSELFQVVQSHGFLDALSLAGQEALVRLVRGRAFANECHICITAIQHDNREIWEQCVDPFTAPHS